MFPQVLFKLVLGNAKLGEAAVYLTVLGGANLVFISAVPLILLLTGAEDFVSPRDLPWPSICGMSALLLGKMMDTNTQTSLMHLNSHLPLIISNVDFSLVAFSVFNFLLNFGVLVTLPTLISLGVVLSVPVNAGESLVFFIKMSYTVMFLQMRFIISSVID